jgi:hypothetical protein
VAAFWKVCASWPRFGPHPLTSLTAFTMELRSVTLCASRAERLSAACCCGEADADGVVDEPADDCFAAGCDVPPVSVAELA